MATSHIRQMEMTPAELFEDFHRRMRLKNRISNASMAIALFEAKSKSGNLSKYITDGLTISSECSSVLERLARNHSDYQYQDYTARVLLDILTNRLTQATDTAKLERYRKGFAAAQRVFEAVRQKKEPEKETVQEAQRVIEEIDREIETMYASEESMYRGSFMPG